MVDIDHDKTMVHIDIGKVMVDIYHDTIMVDIDYEKIMVTWYTWIMTRSLVAW